MTGNALFRTFVIGYFSLELSFSTSFGSWTAFTYMVQLRTPIPGKNPFFKRKYLNSVDTFYIITFRIHTRNFSVFSLCTIQRNIYFCDFDCIISLGSVYRTEQMRISSSVFDRFRDFISVMTNKQILGVIQ